MDKILKFLKKLTKKQRDKIERLIVLIISMQTDTLDVKKVSGYTDMYRVRKGNIRIIYRHTPDKNIITNVDRRGNAYSDL